MKQTNLLPFLRNSWTNLENDEDWEPWHEPGEVVSLGSGRSCLSEDRDSSRFVTACAEARSIKEGDSLSSFVTACAEARIGTQRSFAALCAEARSNCCS